MDAKAPFQRSTRQRQAILEELRQLSSHPTAVGLYEIVRRRLPKVSLATVYRNLELMAEMGVIQKLDYCGAEARFDGDPRQHDHLRCIHCGRVDDLPGSPLDLPERTGDDCLGYEVIGRRLEFVGVCPGCRRPESSPEGSSDDGSRV